MYTKKFSCLILMVLLICLFTGCAGPVFKTTDEDGTSVYINNVRYKALPISKWSVTPGKKEIGYAGNINTGVSEAEGDTDKNFIFIQTRGASAMGPLYRTDKEIPDPSGNSIDKIQWVEYYINEDKNEISDPIENKEIIKSLFDILDTGNKIKLDYSGVSHMVYLHCTASKVTGASYKLNIGMYNGKIMCGHDMRECVEIPQALIEKIAGKTMIPEELPFMTEWSDY